MNQSQAKAWLPLIQAVAEGKKLQVVKMTQGSHEPVWYDVEATEGIYYSLGEYARFRIKPEPKKGWFRAAIFKGAFGCYPIAAAKDEQMERQFQGEKDFIRWLTDRIEYELPEGE